MLSVTSSRNTMTNSPGPSAPRPHDRPKKEKPKKTRKRTKKPKESQEPKQPKGKRVEAAKQNGPKELITQDTLKIWPVMQQNCQVFRRRSQSGHRINLHTFAERGSKRPCVFQTGLQIRKRSEPSVSQASTSAASPASSHSILEKVATKLTQLSLNQLVRSSSSQQNDSIQQRQTPEKKRSRANKKKIKPFPNYLSEVEVEAGLKDSTLFKGTIRINPKNHKEAYVGNEKNNSKADYMILSVKDRNRALEGDEVVLRLKEPEEGYSTNDKYVEVVYITKQVHSRLAVGHLKVLNKEFAELTPRDRRIPFVRIPKISWPAGFQLNPQLYENILFLAHISEWSDCKFAQGLIRETLGLDGDLRIESMAILREHSLDVTPFPDTIRQYLPKSAEIPDGELSYREDVRGQCVFTIDPATARDLDDAVSCRTLENGNFEIGVHISDASFFLPENTPLDAIVQQKATTIYMVDTAYHMLPVELCMHCSLLPGEDKLAFSVFWEMTPSGDIVDKRIKRTVINSCAQLAYEHAQLIIEQPDKPVDEYDMEFPDVHNGYTVEDLRRTVIDLQKIAVILRERRVQNGALRIDQVKVGFSLDATGKPATMWVQQQKQAHRLIEEFMLLANITVAEWIVNAYPDVAFLRLHEPPKQTMLEELQKSLETVGLHIDISSSGAINSSISKYVSYPVLGRTIWAVLNHIFAKSMTRARYFCSGCVIDPTMSFNHYALSVPLYTHFTSPIRRYADIMVHRILAASLGYRDKPNYSPEEVDHIAQNCNRQKYNAKKAGDASSDLFLAHYVEDHQPYEEEAVVVEAKDRSVDVIIMGTGSVVRLYPNNIAPGATWKSEQAASTSESESNDKEPKYTKNMWRILVNFPKVGALPAALLVLEIFTVVRVALTRKPHTNKLEATLLRPPPLVECSS